MNHSNDIIYDTVVIGGGPAGLISSYYLTKLKRKVLLIEKGSSLSQRIESNPKDISSGLGGSGLYSDGKFSYYPSATNLWSLGKNADIERAYNELYDLLKLNNIHIKQWKSNLNNTNNEDFSYINEKNYDSQYINKSERENLIEFIVESIGHSHIFTNTEVISVKYDGYYYKIKCKNHNHTIISKSIINATGRYGSTNLKNIFENIKLKFKKYEVGVRVECNSNLFPLYSDKQIDYKYIYPLNEYSELRTFCCCRDGKVLKSKYDNIVSFNGSSDGPKTGKSNIGMNIRFTSEKENIHLLDEVKEIANGNCKEFELKLQDFFASNNSHLGYKLDSIIKNCILKVFGQDVLNNEDSKIYGPTIEGIGFYPQFEDNNLKLENESIWIAGDCTGIFRGLTAAFISGFFVGEQVDKYLKSIDQENHNKCHTKLNLSEQENLKKYNIKLSSTDEMKLVYTAQSKVYFYCRDVICQYVLERGSLALNPFRVFDYFLGDRVDRNIIRRGNNQLIRTCEELWVFGPISDGVLFEITYAKYLGIPIKYFSIGAKISDIREINLNEINFEPEVHAKQIKKEDLINFISNNKVIDNDYEQLTLDLSDFTK